MCCWCQHFRRESLREGGWGYRCDAFAEGIPAAIFHSEVDHRQAYAGDGGLRFELAEGATLEQALASLYARPPLA